MHISGITFMIRLTSMSLLLVAAVFFDAAATQTEVDAACHALLGVKMTVRNVQVLTDRPQAAQTSRSVATPPTLPLTTRAPSRESGYPPISST